MAPSDFTMAVSPDSRDASLFICWRLSPGLISKIIMSGRSGSRCPSISSSLAEDSM